MPKITLTHLVKRWNNFYGVDDLSLEIEDNAFVTLLGPSGCGKTTTLRMIAGLETPTSGQIKIGDQVVFDSERGIDVPPNKRKVGFLFQNYALWPNMTVEKNITFGLANIDEELPLVNDQSVYADMMLRALSKPDELSELIRESSGKKGLDEAQARKRLVDHYLVTTKAAKGLLALDVHRATDTRAAVESAISHYNSVIDEERRKVEAQGNTLSDKFEIVGPNGKVLTEKRHLSKQEIELRARRVAKMVKIGQFMDRYPSELSGGQQQRVAIARTLAPEPSVLLMDEPLSNLDAKLRLEMRAELQRLHHETGSTFVYVTHDQGEAMTLATQICLLDNAVLQQYDAPLDVYSRPTNLFTADFVGSPPINFVNARGAQDASGAVAMTTFDGRDVLFKPVKPLDVKAWYAEADKDAAEKAKQESERAGQKGFVKKTNAETVFTPPIPMVGDAAAPAEPADLGPDDFVLGIRPACLRVVDTGALEGVVRASMPTGLETTLQISVGDFLLTSIQFGEVDYELGQKVRFDVDTETIMLFSRANGKLLSLGSLEVK